MEVSQRIIILVCAFLLNFRTSTQEPIDVTNFGARGDGKTDDTEAFVKAWDTLCKSQESRPTMVVPADMSFLVQPLQFNGPCSPSHINFQVMGKIVAPSLDEFKKADKWICFHEINGLTINGNGGFDGSATSEDWWKHEGELSRPTMLSIGNSQGVSLSDLTFLRPPRSHISIADCIDVTVQNLLIKAPEDSPNTDGIDISRSKMVHISHSNIGTGDDCIAINSGSSHIDISDINCGPGHGISIGSLGRAEDGHDQSVEYVNVKSCTFTGTQNAARIKTINSGISGFARFISYENITLINAQNPILIDQHYCPHKECDGKSSTIKLSDLSFIGFKGTSETKEAVNLDCSPAIPCVNIKVEDINIKPSMSLNEPMTSNCNNAHGRSSCPTCSPKVNCLSVDDDDHSSPSRPPSPDPADGEEKPPSDMDGNEKAPPSPDSKDIGDGKSMPPSSFEDGSTKSKHHNKKHRKSLGQHEEQLDEYIDFNEYADSQYKK